MKRCPILVLAAACIALAAGPENVLVVMNTNSAASKSAGQYYALKRRIPANNLCRLKTTAAETIDRKVYDQEIEPAVGECLRSRGLSDKVLYIVTTIGVPLRITGTDGLGGDAASVDGELTLLYGRLKGNKYPLGGAVPNPFFGKVGVAFRHPDFPVYLVTRLTAWDFPGVKAMIDRSLQARNAGKFVIDQSGAGNQGDQWLQTAAIRLPSDRLVYDDGYKVLYNATDVIAYAAWGSNDKSRTRRRVGFRWLPGAIVAEYVSTNGRTFVRPPETWNISPRWDKPELNYAGSPQSLLGDYLEEGATGGSGHVWEPYLTFTPRPDLLLPAWYSGRTLAESFYVAIPGLSWQNIVAGDPLCSLGTVSSK